MALNIALLDLSLYLFLYIALYLAMPTRRSMADVGSLKTSETTVRSWEGHVPATTILDGVLNGVQVVQPTVNPKPKKVQRKDFPADFKFGCATSALQTEGAGDEGGRGPSTWDRFIQDGVGDKDIAVDSYNHYKEDVQLLKNMGADTYRFSISWSRILPDGTVAGGVNQEGINFYNSFINELIKNGITPFVTLFHFDLPQALQDKYEGFLSRQIVDDFKAYADICYHNFGDRVKYWTTINEPQIFGPYGYETRNPNPKPATDPYLATHNIILAHAAAVKLYREKYQATQGGEIGVSPMVQCFEPYGDTLHDKDAAKRAFDFLVGWFMEPLVFGDYPFIMKALIRDGLPEFTEAEKDLVKGSFDFIGVNYYTSRYALSQQFNKDDNYSTFSQYQYAELKVDRNGKPIGDRTPGSTQMYIYPQGLRDALIYMKQEYNNPKFYVTENGYPEKRNDTIPIKTALKDNARIKYIISHLFAISEAMKRGVNVNGYFMWALLDCMEMGSGYTARFGLAYTNYLNNLNRIPKKSAKWLKSFVGR
ncbi:beta-glucosidase 13-like isoform X2 [Quercus robur]|uniref:beta-glucosidase 13-like isoform X2 n=1 Tax=Quercus robur TaxID=38942 RepID=UPI0021624423|nr:beta-glucosidase 13-like isoform X2 [Quercus robur]